MGRLCRGSLRRAFAAGSTCALSPLTWSPYPGIPHPLLSGLLKTLLTSVQIASGVIRLFFGEADIQTISNIPSFYVTKASSTQALKGFPHFFQHNAETSGQRQEPHPPGIHCGPGILLGAGRVEGKEQTVQAWTPWMPWSTPHPST